MLILYNILLGSLNMIAYILLLNSDMVISAVLILQYVCVHNCACA